MRLMGWCLALRILLEASSYPWVRQVLETCGNWRKLVESDCKYIYCCSIAQIDFTHFLIGAEKFPVDALGLEPLRGFQQKGGVLQPGQLVSVFPPFCIAVNGGMPQTLEAVTVSERLTWLFKLYEKIKNLPDGQTIQLTAE